MLVTITEMVTVSRSATSAGSIVRFDREKAAGWVVVVVDVVGAGSACMVEVVGVVVVDVVHAASNKTLTTRIDNIICFITASTQAILSCLYGKSTPR